MIDHVVFSKVPWESLVYRRVSLNSKVEHARKFQERVRVHFLSGSFSEIDGFYISALFIVKSTNGRTSHC